MLFVQAIAKSHVQEPHADSLVQEAVAQSKLIWDKEMVHARLVSIIGELPLASQEIIIEIMERLEADAFDAQLMPLMLNSMSAARSEHHFCEHHLEHTLYL